MTAIVDEKDLAILRVLEADAGGTLKSIARKLGLPMTTVHSRLERLRKNGVIRGLRLKVDYAKAGRPVAAYVQASFSYPSKKFSQQEAAERIMQFEEVEEAALVTGETDIIVKVRVPSTAALNSFITKKLRTVDGVDKTVTLVVLQEFDEKKENVLKNKSLSE